MQVCFKNLWFSIFLALDRFVRNIIKSCTSLRFEVSPMHLDLHASIGCVTKAMKLLTVATCIRVCQ
jgi:hypothetical protein